MATDTTLRLARLRTRWAAIGAAVAVTLGGGGIGLAQATATSGDKPVTVTVDAERILDTRTSVGLAGAFTKDTPRDVQVTGPVDVVTDTGTAEQIVVPFGATAVLVNVTVVAPGDQGFLTLRAAGATGRPKTSTVNFQPGSVEPNAATVDLSADGKIQVWVFMPSAAAMADVLIDVVGYTIDHHHDDRYHTQDEVASLLSGKVDRPAGTSSVRVRAAAFTPTAALTSTYFWQYNSWANTNPATVCFVAPVDLPAGVTVTQFSAAAQLDEASSVVEAWLYSYISNAPTIMASVNEDGLAGAVTLSTTAITGATTSATDDYVARFCLTNGTWFDGVTITFDYQT